VPRPGKGVRTSRPVRLERARRELVSLGVMMGRMKDDHL
jgi:hypothetical protein